MIDIHCHLIPYVDDGAEDWDSALEMARREVADGIVEAIVTPHWAGPQEGVDEQLARLAELEERLREEEIPLKLHPGNELILVPELPELIAAGKALTLAGTSYLLLETAQLAGGPFVKQAVFSLRSAGFQVILAHPARAPFWQERPDDLEELVHAGCHLQINAGSLTGGFGRRAQTTAEYLLRRGWVAFLASDAHNLDSRPPGLREAVQRAAHLIGEERARDLVEKNPARLLRNRPVYVEPLTRQDLPRRSWWNRLLHRGPG